ncbi:MAG: hypothetical protein HYW85_01390 [Deltaproteobacteria bacterium]|nr:hypothetical protein [Deltaproteobacteria bacterium]
MTDTNEKKDACCASSDKKEKETCCSPTSISDALRKLAKSIENCCSKKEE